MNQVEERPCGKCGGVGETFDGGGWASDRPCSACGGTGVATDPEPVSPATPGRADTERWRLCFCDGCGEMLGVEDHIRIRSEHNDLGDHQGQRMVAVVPESSLTAAEARVSGINDRLSESEFRAEDAEQRVRELEGALEEIRERVADWVVAALHPEPVSPSTQPTPQTCPSCEHPLDQHGSWGVCTVPGCRCQPTQDPG